MLLLIVFSVVFNLFIGTAASCEIPLSPEHGTQHLLGGSQVGSLALYSCDDGWKLVGASASKCLNNGQWSPPTPRCIKNSISCDAPKHPENGIVTYTTLNVGSELTFVCNNGYHLQGTRPVYCTSDGEWSTANVKCVAKRCDRPEHPENGQAVFSSLNFRSQLMFKCDDGYLLKQNEPVFCTSDGTWNTAGVRCVAIEVSPNCSCTYNSHDRKLAADVNGLGLWNGEKVRKGEKLTLRCYDPAKHLVLPNATKISGTLELTCDDCRIWEDSDLPSCEDVGSESCEGDPPSMDNGYPVVNNRSHGYTIYYRCNKHYVKATKGTVRCSYGQWVGQTPTCVDDRCYVSQLNHPGLEKPQVDFIKYGENFPAKCKEGFKLSSKWIKVSCKAGKWDIPEPTCVEEICAGEPPMIRNGRYHFQSRDHNSKVVYECDPGYEMRKLASVQCLRGQWTGQPPVCDRDISVVNRNEPDYAYFDGTESAATTDLTTTDVSEGYAYFEGTESAATTDLTTTDVSEGLGELSGGNTTITASPRQPENYCFCRFEPPRSSLDAVVNKTRLEYGGTVKKGNAVMLSCRHRSQYLFWPNGMRTLNASMTCEVCQSWGSNDLPYCQQAQPGDSFIILNANMTVQPGGAVESRLGRTLKISCINWYTEYPVWMPPVNLPFTYKAEVLNEHYTSFQTLLHIANFKLQHAGRYECTARSPRYPQYYLRSTKLDLITKCYGEPYQILHGRYHFQSRSPSSRVEYVCDDGYEMSGRSTVQCLRGEWRGQFPECVGANYATSVSVEQEVTPTDPSNNLPRTIPNEPNSEDSCSCIYNNPDRGILATYSKRRLRYGDKVRKGHWTQLQCLDQTRELILPNGTITRTIRLTCIVCETWEVYQLPACVVSYRPEPEVRCPWIRETDVFSIQFTNGRKINSTAHFRCKDANLKIVAGLDTRICQHSGEWSGSNPDCKAHGCLIGDFVETAPINLVPSMEGVTEELQPVGSELSMHCEEGWVLTEDKKATCGPLGKWNFGKAQCVVGCQLNITDKSSALIINPYKDYYRFGESVTASCSEGFEPTSDVERLLCMGRGWSDTIPNCKEKTNK